MWKVNLLVPDVMLMMCLVNTRSWGVIFQPIAIKSRADQKKNVNLDTDLEEFLTVLILICVRLQEEKKSIKQNMELAKYKLDFIFISITF